jgi:Flp pilus assembly pilin Flp
MRSLIVRFLREEDGMEMVEWAIVAAVFALAGVVAWGQLANTLKGALTQIGGRVNDSVNAGIAAGK